MENEYVVVAGELYCKVKKDIFCEDCAFHDRKCTFPGFPGCTVGTSLVHIPKEMMSMKEFDLTRQATKSARRLLCH
jgi:hypothetical protein